MFLMVSESKCPYCGTEGVEWKKAPKVFKCPSCNAFFNHFGVLIEGVREKPEMT